MGYWEMVKKIVGEADIVIEVLDSRMPQQSRNHQLEKMVEESGKKLLVVINKSDLISKRQAEKEKAIIRKRCVFISAKKKSGVKLLKIELGALSAGKEAKVAVVGYPNTGKSSIINMLKGRKAARTSSVAGFTKGKQHVRISRNIMLIDSPGVIPLGEKDETTMAMLAAKNPERLSDIGGTGTEIAQALLKGRAKELEELYGVTATDGEEFLEKLAMRRNKLLKGAKPDINAAAKILISDFQKGKISRGK